MFARLYFVLGLLALAGFSYGQYRGVGPFDHIANGSPATRHGSTNYHK